MLKLTVILMSSAALIFVLSLVFVPKDKRGEAQFIFLFVQLPTWLLGLFAVHMGLLKYPVHILARANSTCFIFEYLILPIYCIHFNSRYPANSGTLHQLLYYCAASGLLTGAEVIVEKYTEIIEYTGWTWYATFLSVIFILWLSRFITRWFFKPSNCR